MVKCVEGVYKKGRVELLEKPGVSEGARAYVTFVPDDGVDLKARGIEREHARDLRSRLSTFTDDWELPEMEAYDAL